MKNIYEATSKDAIEKLKEKLNDGITFVSFFSPVCGPCLMLEPILEGLVNKGLISLIRINVLDYPDLAKEYNVNAWPTNFIYKNNEFIEKIIGYQPIEEWEKLIERIL